MSDDESLLEFPCDFPIKVLGRDGPEFRNETRRIIAEHGGDMAADTARARKSRDGNYLALSFVVHVDSRERLDALYEELSGNEHIMVVL